MAAADDPRLSVRFEHIKDGSNLCQILTLLINQANLLGIIAGEIYRLVPDTSRWVLVLTGDLGATVNDHRIRAGKEPSYTTTRGAGHVGGITIPNGHGTFDIVVSGEAIIEAPDGLPDEELFTHALANARHLGRHEAGHVLLALRGEDSRSYIADADAVTSRHAAGWIDQVSWFMDDFRIERHTRQHAPSPNSHDRGLAHSLDHLAAALRESSTSWSHDMITAVVHSDTAVSGFIRVLAYLAAEIGLDESGQPASPTHTSGRWDFYAARMWTQWSDTFHRLQPVDIAMTRDELSTVLTDLCELAARWASTIGYDRGVTEDGRQYAYWTPEQLSPDARAPLSNTANTGDAADAQTATRSETSDASGPAPG